MRLTASAAHTKESAEALAKGKADMMPLIMAKTGEDNSIKKVCGKEDVRKFLASLGFVVGSRVKIITQNSGNVIVSVKESRVAISREMATKIMV